MNEEDLKELLELLATDYGRGYLDGVVGGLSMLLKISKEAEKNRYEAIRLFEKHFISKRVTYSLEDIVQILTIYLENTKTQIGGKNE